MEWVIELIMRMPQWMLMLLILAVLFAVLFIVFWAFKQGREISFWPPKIGPRKESGGIRPVPTLNDEEPAEAVPAPEETVNPILECQDQMERAGLPTQETLARLQQIHLYHPELFADSNGFTTVVDLVFPFSGVVTLDGKQLRLRSIYRYAKDENDRAWESLYKEHLDLLNERWRRDEKYRLRSGTFARYLGRLERHIAHTTSYIESYWQETDARALARASQLQEEVKGIAQPDASERSRLIETERLLNSLHTLIKSVQPLAMG